MSQYFTIKAADFTCNAADRYYAVKAIGQVVTATLPDPTTVKGCQWTIKNSQISNNLVIVTNTEQTIAINLELGQQVTFNCDGTEYL